MSHRDRMTLAAFALPLLVALASTSPLAPPAREAPWQPPVTPIVIERPFTAPAGPYSAGHRGVDLRADPGSVIRAPAPGVVRVAGRVAGKAVVSIDHPHRILGRTGWRTTYEGVVARVDAGDMVDAGDPLGGAARGFFRHGRVQALRGLLRAGAADDLAALGGDLAAAPDLPALASCASRSAMSELA